MPISALIIDDEKNGRKKFIDQESVNYSQFANGNYSYL